MLSIALISTWVSTPLIRGQGAPSPSTNPAKAAAADEAIIELSPFTITASQDNGWIATQTLAGSRLKTDFKDVAQPLEVMTKAFLDDMALNNFEQALEYSTNVAGPLEYSDNSGNAGMGFGNLYPVGANKIRGLGSGTSSADFFATSMSSDSYNVERITVARGPNALLFGMGSPSGIIKTSMQRGDLRKNALRLGFQMTSDASRRGTIDINRVVLKDKLAVRLNALADEGLTHIKPSYDRQKRTFGAITARPFSTTTITVNYEHTHWDSNRAKTQLPVDQLTPWLNASKVAGSPYTVDQPLFDNSRALPSFATNPIFVGPPANAQALVIFGGNGIADGTVSSWGRSVTTRGPDTIPAAFNPYNSFDQFTQSLHGASNPVPYNVNVFGNTMLVRLKSGQWHVNVEQKLAKNLYLEAAWYHEHYSWELGDAGAGGFIYPDPNMYLPDGVTPNPNVGKYYLQRTGANQRNNIQIDQRNSYRLSLSYELDLRNRFGWVGKWILGRLRPAAVFEQSNYETISQNFFRSILDNPVLSGTSISTFTTGSVGTGTTGTGTRNWATNNNRAFTPRFYLGGPEGNAANFSYDVFAPVWSFKDANGNPFGVYTRSTPWTSVEGYPLVSGTVPSGSLQKTNTMMFALQDYILHDRVVLLYGYRRDSAKSASVNSKYQTTDWSGLVSSYTVARYGAWGDTQTGATSTEGVVVRVLPSLSLLYNRSNTFQPNLGTRDPFGNPLKGETGKANDVGINLGLFQDRLQARVSRYENTSGPANMGNNFQDPIRGNLATMDTNIIQLDPSVTILNGDKGGFRTLGQPSYRVTGDRRAEGYEMQVSWRPNPNWDFIVNGSKSATVLSNIGNAFIDWINARLPVWQAATTTVNGAKVNVWNTQPYDLSPSTTMTFAQYYQTVIHDQLLANWEANNGTSDQGRKYGANFIGKYRFTAGRLKNLSANLAFRYRSGAALGYAAKTGSGGVLLLDPAQPILGPASVLTDLGLNYSGRLKVFDGTRYRVQLNIRNLFNEWTLVPVRAFTTGQFGRWQQLPPRTYVVSCTFDL